MDGAGGEGVGGGEGWERGEGHVEAFGGDGLLLAFEPGAARDERGLAVGPGVLGLGVREPFGAFEDEAAGDEAADGVGGGDHAVLAPGAGFEVVDGVDEFESSGLGGEGLERVHHVLGELALPGPGGDAGALDLPAQGDHVVPGRGVGPAVPVEEAPGVPDAPDHIGVVEEPDGPVEGPVLDHAGQERVPQRHGRVLDAGGVEEFGEVEDLVGGGERGDVEPPGAGVVHDVGRLAGHEAGLEDLADLLEAFVGDRGVRVALLVERDGVPRVLLAVAAVEHDDFQVGVGGDAERVLVGDGAGRLLGGVVAAGGDAAGEDGGGAGRAGGAQDGASGGVHEGPRLSVVQAVRRMRPA
ncbi:hypothetical protein SAMN05216270_10174 [Glycomyces harbinensis]|uniref:Uncharacterized protein n=1 Tax=Glycomyces harbinensis TaxID=58114 RepID=A0A1G6QRW8_9ACTN|nr:hypothetical protein [Glycomyces harbinensis]SDC95109.1 hypothetical protein SAMN05216270_10174 [Glycomyces harbinensis]